ncbi:hypothetical protein V8F20_007479 [Naviculisporaceae sp. PSN 640]
MAGTKRPHCWVDYDSDDSNTLSEGEPTTARTAAPAPGTIAAPTRDSLAPQTKRRRILDSHPAAGSSPSSSNRPTTFSFAPSTAPLLRRNRDLPAFIPSPPTDGRDLLSPLSNELLLKILSYLPLKHLLAVAPVSQKFYHLAGDSQLWKALYYERFVLPRALRIPGFRTSSTAAPGDESGLGPGRGRGPGHKLHYSGRRRIWADGRLGGIVDESRHGRPVRRVGEEAGDREGGDEKTEEEDKHVGVNWKREYKIRYNWSRGKCVVEELRLGDETDDLSGDGEVGGKKKMLAKVVEGIAITADEISGLRAWDLKTRMLIAQIDLTSTHNERVTPSCIAIDEKQPNGDVIDVAVGFADGSFGVWRVSLTGKHKRIQERYRHESSSNGELIALAFSYPYLLTATEAVLISLYTFDVPDSPREDGRREDFGKARKAGALPAPYLLTSLNSHTSRAPLALSIRRAATSTIASIAYTFSTLQGWSIGIQDLHIRPGVVNSTPDITTTQIAYTTPMDTGYVLRLPPTPPSTTARRHHTNRAVNRGHRVLPQLPSTHPEPEPGPTSLCYTHPYLLATLPDNTLILHMCTSNASSLSISPGIRLWGHTSGISDAEVTARGKAVSVSSRGEEMRVWELEGRLAGMGSSRSVEIKPGFTTASQDGDGERIGPDWEERRSWVGFDDEMVIVLKERKGGSESLMVYDFT